MRILENGIYREMTEKEIKEQKVLDEKMAQEMAIHLQNDKPAFEEFIENIAEAETIEDVIKVAKKIKKKHTKGREG